MRLRNTLACWLLWVITLGGAAGCLFPQDDQMFPDLPPKKNSPPRFLESTVKPPQVAPLQLGDGCPLPRFEVSVEDPDPADPIRSRWWVDPDTEFTKPSFVGRVLDPSSTARRAAPVTGPTALTAQGGPLRVTGEHRLVVVIADGEFSDGIQTRPNSQKLPDGGTVDDPTYTATLSWTLTTDLTPCGK